MRDILALRDYAQANKLAERVGTEAIPEASGPQVSGPLCGRDGCTSILTISDSTICRQCVLEMRMSRLSRRPWAGEDTSR
jgi:hypothetical protein